MRRYTLINEAVRARAVAEVAMSPIGSVVMVRDGDGRNLEQNAKLWAVLGDISAQVEWYGKKLTAENWKDVLTAGLERQAVVPGIDGGFVVLGTSTSRMSKKRFSELLELAVAFGTEKGVRWRDEATA